MEHVSDRLTEEAWWDDYWRHVQLPQEVTKSEDISHNEILSVFDRHLGRVSGQTALEIGGAPGQYLAYVVRNFGYEGHVLDYSRIGCDKSRENFSKLGLPVAVHQADLFDATLEIGRFDLVYSLGFIEHFQDTATVLGAHARLLKPGGLLIVGFPNFQGVNGWFLRRLAPELLGKHNVAMMDFSTWPPFERRNSLEVLYRQYVGGFEPRVFCRREHRTFSNIGLLTVARLTERAFRNPVFKRINSPSFSHYAMAVYRLGAPS